MIWEWHTRARATASTEPLVSAHAITWLRSGDGPSLPPREVQKVSAAVTACATATATPDTEILAVMELSSPSHEIAVTSRTAPHGRMIRKNWHSYMQRKVNVHYCRQ